ncbi:MAG TPA: hypothetical protein ENO20_12710 [Bacteroides sp.]|mgnify:CR=1 FL=1|nr:hypothetical protein [Bacteroides sp.]
MPQEQSMGEKLGLPRQDPGYIPCDMDEENIQSVGFLISSSVSYFFQNLSRRQRPARKLFMIERNRMASSCF